jgi:hypothetical protein
MEFYIFLFITAVVFTFAGAKMSKRSIVKKVSDVAVATCMDSLISDGYLKTQGTGDSMTILKWTEWNNDTTN